MFELVLNVDPSVVAEGTNMVFLLAAIFLIFFMHTGFAMLESGQVRSKNVANQLTKNMLTWGVGIVTFFIVGMGVANYVGALAGGGSYSVGDIFQTGFDPAIMATENIATFTDGASGGWVSWLFSAVFALTAATIVAGAVAGRAKLRAYIGYVIVFCAIIYPVGASLVWYSPGGGEAWLANFDMLGGAGFNDFAGGIVVHAVGGVAGLAAAWMLGPRLDRYNEDGSLNIIPGHSMTFAVLGAMILAFGWYGFNVGTSFAVFDVVDGELVFNEGGFAVAGRVAMATTIGMTVGAIGAALAAIYLTGKVDTLYVANGILAGLVGVTGVANLISPMGAIVIGLLAGVQLPFAFRAVNRYLKVDDVCAVFPVHGTAGIIGIVLYPLWSIEGSAVADGVVAGGIVSVEASQFAPQLFGTVVLLGWTFLATAAVWGAFRAVGQARVDEQHEREGLDGSEHGVDTYPEFGRANVATDGGLETHDLRPDGGTDIKMVTAVIRPDKLGAVKEALAEIDAPSLTVTNVSGRGSQAPKTGQWRGEEYVVDLHQKVKVECMVADTPAEDVVVAIQDAASTGQPGDGKVFIIPVEDALQVRTGERGPSAV